MSNLNQRIQEIVKIFQDNRKVPSQEFLTFGELEKAALVSLKRRLDIPKGQAIAVACRFLLEELEKEDQSIKEKTDEKK